jgi:hypothetical protein
MRVSEHHGEKSNCPFHDAGANYPLQTESTSQQQRVTIGGDSGSLVHY